MSSMQTPSVATYDNKPAPSPSISEADKYITFRLSNYLFALPSERILKVVTTPPPSQGGMVSMGLVQLEQYSIQTLDLPKMMNLQREDTAISKLKLNIMSDDSSQSGDLSVAETNTPVAIEQTEQVENPPFLMVLQDADDMLWGIAIHEPPDLMDIPQYALKPVPPEKRLTRALRWVSHVVTYDLGGDRHTLLVLDLSVLLSTKLLNPSAEDSASLEIEPPLFKESSTLPEQEATGALPDIEPPLGLSELEVETETGRKEEMYA